MNRSQFSVLMLLAALWGASFLFMRIAAPVLGAVWLIEFRVLIAGVVLLPVIVLRSQLPALKTHAPRLLIAGALNAALPFTLLAYAAIDISAGLTSILNATVPIFGALLAYFISKERLGPTKVVGIVLGFLGVVVLMSWRHGESETPPLVSIGAGLVAALSYACAANYTKWRLTTVPPLVYVTGSQLGAALLLIPLVPFFVPTQSPSLAVVASVLGLALLSTSLAFALYFQLIHQIGPTQTLTVTYLIPLFAIVWGNWFLDEPINRSMLFGCALVLSGTALANEFRWSQLKIRRNRA